MFIPCVPRWPMKLSMSTTTSPVSLLWYILTAKQLQRMSTRTQAASPSGLLLQGFCSQSTGRCVLKSFYINHDADQKQLDFIAEGIFNSSQSNCYLIITITEPTSASASSSSRWQAYKTHHVAVSQLTAGSLYVSFEKAAGLNVNPCVNYQHNKKSHAY